MLQILLVMKVVFEQFFGRNIEHFTTYLFCGNLLFSWFSESTNHGMRSLYGNAAIFTKVNVPKYLFLFAGSVQTAINFALTLVVFFFFFCFPLGNQLLVSHFAVFDISKTRRR